MSLITLSSLITQSFSDTTKKKGYTILRHQLFFFSLGLSFFLTKIDYSAMSFGYHSFIDKKEAVSLILNLANYRNFPSKAAYLTDSLKKDAGKKTVTEMTDRENIFDFLSLNLRVEEK